MANVKNFRALYSTPDGKQTLNAFSIVTVDGKPELRENTQIIGKNGKQVMVAVNRAARRASQSKKFLKKQGL